MFCATCGNQLSDGSSTCNHCGTAVKKQAAKKNGLKHTRTIFRFGIFAIVLILIVVGKINDSSKKKNLAALENYNNGAETESVIADLTDATESAVYNDTKLQTNLNLAYVYATELDYENARTYFVEALQYAEPASFQHNLISAEIALVDQDADTAYSLYQKAYEQQPDDFQINNALALFYLDLDDIAPDYYHPPYALMHAKKAFDAMEEPDRIAKENLALAYFFNQDFEQTIQLLQDTNLVAAPHMALFVGISYASLGDEVNASTYLQMAKDGGMEIPEDYIMYVE